MSVVRPIATVSRNFSCLQIDELLGMKMVCWDFLGARVGVGVFVIIR